MTNNEAKLFRQPTADSRQPTADSRQPTADSHNSALVSIIIPAYNTGLYIHRAIESSQRQTHKNIEIIIIDDGSTDDTLKAAQSYAVHDDRIRVFTQDNAGVSAARNHGIREARGEYITFLDSDDWLEDNAVEVLLKAQQEHPGMLIAANFYRVKGDLSKSIFIRKFTQPAFFSLKEIAESYCHIGNAHAVFHSAWAKIYSSQILAHSGVLFPEGVGFSEDAVFVIRYLHEVSGAFAVPVPVYNMFERPTSAERSGYKPAMIQSQLDAHDIMINHPKNTPELRKLFTLARTSLITSLYLSAGLSGKQKGMTSEEILRIRNLLRPHAKEYLSYKELPVKRKLLFACSMYTPLFLGRAVMKTWRFVKRIIGRD